METAVWDRVFVHADVYNIFAYISARVCMYAHVHFPLLSFFRTLEHLVLWKALIQTELRVNVLCTSQERTASG